MEIEVTPENSWSSSKHEVDKEIVVLFNPWCKGEERERERELTLSERGDEFNVS